MRQLGFDVMNRSPQPSSERRFPLRALVIGWHEHHPGIGTMSLMKFFRDHPAIVSFGTVERLVLAAGLLRRGVVNTVFLDLRIGRYYGTPNGYGGTDQLAPSIRFIEE